MLRLKHVDKKGPMCVIWSKPVSVVTNMMWRVETKSTIQIVGIMEFYIMHYRCLTAVTRDWAIAWYQVKPIENLLRLTTLSESVIKEGATTWRIDYYLTKTFNFLFHCPRIVFHIFFMWYRYRELTIRQNDLYLRYSHCVKCSSKLS